MGGNLAGWRIQNLTPHALRLRGTDGRLAVVEPSGRVARVETDARPLVSVSVEGVEVPVVDERPGDVTDLPDPEPGRLLAVSRLVFHALPYRHDLACPTDFERDDQGVIVSARALSGRVDERPAPDHLVVLAGGNPLPNLQAVLTLRPRRVTVLASAATERSARNLEAACVHVEPPITFEAIVVDDANDRAQVTEALAGVERGWALSYTGGTKVMSVTARALYETHGDGRPEHASIVDGGIRCDDGTRLSLREPTIRAASEIDAVLGTVARLHGHELYGGAAPEHAAHEVRASAEELREVIHSNDPSRPPKRNGRGDTAAGLLDREGGYWLEQLVGSLVAEVSDAVVVNARLGIGGRRRGAPELDVVARRGWDLAVLSCTVTKSDAARLERKRKLFEARRRAEQLGGSRTIGALVCLGAPREVENLRADVAPGLVPDEQLVVVGASDLDRWLRPSGARVLATRLWGGREGP